MVDYKKTQIGWIAIALLSAIIILLFCSYTFQWGNPPSFKKLIYLSIFLLVCILLFFKLTIKLKNSILKIIFGVGLIRFNINIDKLISVRLIELPWYYGIGIKKTSEGMLFNIQGKTAVEVKYINKKGGSKSVTVGTADPEELRKVLESRFK